MASNDLPTNVLVPQPRDPRLIDGERTIDLTTTPATIDPVRLDPGPPWDGEPPERLLAQATWRQAAITHARGLRAQLAAQSDEASPENRAKALELIASAERAASDEGSPRIRRWWHGTLHERVWGDLHAAEVFMVCTVTDSDSVPIVARRAVGRASEVLEATDPTLIEVKRCLAEQAPIDRREVAALLQKTYNTSDEHFAESRGFRNRLVIFALLATTATVCLLVLAIGWSGLAFAGESPQVLTGMDFILIALFGALGALMSSVPSVASTGGTRNPFSLPTYQLLMKISLGPLFAVVGMFALGSKIFDELAMPSTLTAALIWAFLFGSSQQLLLGRLADRRVDALVASSGESST